MDNSDQIQKVLEEILRDLTDIRSELRILKENNVGKEHLAEIQKRIESLERLVPKAKAETQAPAPPVKKTELPPPQQAKVEPVKTFSTQFPPLPEIPPAPIIPPISAAEVEKKTPAPLSDKPAPESLLRKPPPLPQIKTPAAPVTPPRHVEPTAPAISEKTPAFTRETLTQAIEAEVKTQPVPPSPPSKPRPPFRPPAPPKKKWDWGDVEANAAVWGTRVGVFIVVVGLGYLLSIGFRRLDVFGKAMVVYGACIGMWTTGVVFERLEKYSTWAKIMIAGGWGGIYITTFLIHYLPEARLIEDPANDIFLLMGIAAGMIIHSFRYRSEALSTLTYFIAFITIALSIHLANQTFFSLVATGVLSVSMLFILYRMQWYRLALFSTAACYGTHTIWLNPLTSVFHTPVGHTTEFWTGLFMLALYWLTFTMAVFLTRPKDKREEALSLWMAAINYVSFVAVFRYHVGSLHPEWRWYFAVGVAIAYAILSYLAYSLKRNNLYTLNLVIAALSATMTFYFRFLGGNWLAIAWLLQAEAFYVAGLLGDEKRFRWIGVANFALVCERLLSNDLLLTDELTFFGLAFYHRTLIFATVAVFFYVNALVREALAYRITRENTYSPLFSYVASILWFTLMLKNWFPDDLLKAAVTSSVMGLVLMETGIRRNNSHFRAQGLFFAFMAIIAALWPLASANDFYYTQSIYYRIGCEAAVIIIAYVIFARFQRLATMEKEGFHLEFAAAMFSAVAAVIGVVLLYREFEPKAPIWLALAWLILGLALLEVGLALKNALFRIQGFLIAGIVIAWALFSLISHPEWYEHPLEHSLSVGLVIFGLFYLFGRLLVESGKEKPTLSLIEREEFFSESGPALSLVFSTAGTLILILLLRQELIGVRPLFIAVTWLLAAVALIEAGIGIKNRPLRMQGLVVATAAFVCAIFYNLEAGGKIGPINERIVTLALCIFTLYYIFERIGRRERTQEKSTTIPAATPVISWLAAALVLLLIEREVWVRIPAWVGVCWVAPMIIFALLAKRRSSFHFLAQALATAVLIFSWTLFVTIPANGAVAQEEILAQRVFSVSPIIILFYALFGILLARGDKLAGAERSLYTSYVRDSFSWAATILLVAIVTVEVNDLSRAVTTVVWVGLFVVLFEAGAAIRNSALKLQGCLLAAATFARALLVNLERDYGQFLFTSVRGASLIAVAAGLYYLYLRLRNSEEQTPLRIPYRSLGSIMAWMATAVVATAIGSELENAWVAPGWAGLLLIVLVAGAVLREKNLLYQSLVLLIPITAGVLWRDFPLHGTMECRVASGLAIGALFAARVLWQFLVIGRISILSPERPSEFLINSSRHLFSMPAAALLTILIPLEFHGELSKYLTIAWACDGFFLMIMGFALKDRILRLVGLVLLSFCVLKVFYDLWVLKIDRIYKVIALIGLGSMLIIIGLIYSRFREQIKKFIVD